MYLMRIILGSEVTDVVSHIGLVGRILKFGNLRVDTAGTPFAGVLFKGLRFKDLEEAKREVEKLVKREAT